MNLIKRSVVDFLCAFLAFAIILISIVLVTDKSFFEGAVVIERETGTLELFGTVLELNDGLVDVFTGLLYFNGNIFGKGVWLAAEKAAEFTLEYIGDFFKMSLAFAEAAVGAR